MLYRHWLLLLLISLCSMLYKPQLSAAASDPSATSSTGGIGRGVGGGGGDGVEEEHLDDSEVHRPSRGIHPLHQSPWNTNTSSTPKPRGVMGVMLSDEDNINNGGDGGESGGGVMEEQLVVRGQKVTLGCSVVDEDRVRQHRLMDDTQTVRWFHDDKEIAADMRVTWSVTGRLEISHTVSSDSGIWRCIAVEGNIGDPIRLIVTIPPERPFLVYGGAQLAAGARLTTREGNSLTLHCVVEGGNPSPSVTWHLNRVDVTHNSQVRSEWRGPEEQFATISNITLSTVTKEDHNATIACVLSHPALPKPLPVPLKLNIEYPPDFRLRRWPSWGSPLREGVPVSLLCLVDANPTSPPSWVKETENGQVRMDTGSGWLNITRVSAETRGWYKCTTVHSFGHFASHSVFINVLPAGEVHVAPPRMVEASIGDALSLPCTSPGVTTSSVCWSKLLPEGRHHGVSRQNALQLRKIDYSDAGLYKCTTEVNEDTVMESEHVQILVSGAPIIIAANTSIRAVVGNSISLWTRICSHPTAFDITWMTPDRRYPMFPGEVRKRYSAYNLSIIDHNGCQDSGLQINKVSSRDTGSWVLVAVNSLGAGAVLITVNITKAASHAVAASTAGAAHLHSHPPPPIFIMMLLVPILWINGSKSSSLSSSLPLFIILIIFTLISASWSCELLCLLK